MEQILINNPDAKEYAVLIRSFLWSSCAPTYVLIMGSWALIKILKAVFKDV